jgi:hypothetical protein
MSADSVSQWAQACIDADAIVGMTKGPYDEPYELGTRTQSETLRQEYNAYCRQHGLRPIDDFTFGKTCTDMFGERKRLKAQPSTSSRKSSRRPWGYDVPDGNTWQRKLDARLGIK